MRRDALAGAVRRRLRRLPAPFAAHYGGRADGDAAALSRLHELWHARRSFRRGSAALAALDLLPHYPVLTIRRLAALLGVSAPAAGQAVAQLAAAGVLVERTGYARATACSRPPRRFSILNRPFGAAPLVPER